MNKGEIQYLQEEESSVFDMLFEKTKNLYKEPSFAVLVKVCHGQHHKPC